MKSGCMIVVVGPSGAGKDSIINGAREHFANNSRIGFVRRVITRPCVPGAEQHDSVDERTFLTMVEQREFAVHWRANGLYYGIPASTLDQIAAGAILILNGSRGALDNIRAIYTDLQAVQIKVTDQVLRARLVARQRETGEQIDARLQRNASLPTLAGDDVIDIDNSAARPVAIERFIELLQSRLS